MNVENPLYAKPVEVKTEKNVATARIDNAVAGICPKCQTQMGQAALGQSMGNQTVYFCNLCRVASPIPVT